MNSRHPHDKFKSPVGLNQSHPHNGRHKEYEFKYRATNISLTEFKKVMASISGERTFISVSSWDHYFVKDHQPDMFLRFRENPGSPQLTIKQRTSTTNNWDRFEVDLPLIESKTPGDLLEDVNMFAKISGWTSNFSIYKSCFIYDFKEFNFVYYVVFNECMSELDTYIEVEINKDVNLSDPISFLRELEQQLVPLGIGPGNRLKKSLFEIWRR
jgi:hypothetical protein